jgi:molybdopterin-guanine dinucleotide biosynthesis protein A
MLVWHHHLVNGFHLMNKSANEVSCIILAGGEGKRVGGVDKGLLEYREKPLIEHVIEKVSPQVDDIVISANRNTERYQHYSQKVISDESERYLGPLAGINAALTHCQHDRVLIVACDTPFLPSDIIYRFLSSQTDANLHIASTNKQLQLVMLIHKNLHDSIAQSLHEGQLRLMHWAISQKPEIVEFENGSAFKNFNYNDDFDS